MTAAARPRDSVALLLQHARTAGVPRGDALSLLGTVLGRSRAWLIAHDEVMLGDAQSAACRRLVERHAGGEPLAYLLGEKEFHGLRLGVTPDVLIPRADTETLVDWALALLTGALADRPAPEVLDLGTGSGAIALAVKAACPQARVTAFDRSGAALDVARANASALALDVAFAPSDWWSAADGRRFDLVLSNPPYIAEGDPHLPALRHEPRGALVSGASGLDDIERIIRDAGAHLYAGGWLLIEHGYDQGEAVRGLFDATGTWDEVQTRRDLAGHERCSGGLARHS